MQLENAALAEKKTLLAGTAPPNGKFRLVSGNLNPRAPENHIRCARGSHMVNQRQMAGEGTAR